MHLAKQGLNMNLDWLLAPQYLGWLWDGFLLTLWLSACAGLILTAMRDSSLRPLRWLAVGYSSLFRNTPLLVQLFFWYFAAGQILPSSAMQWLNTSHQIGPIAWPSFEFLAGFFGLTLYSTAFIAEEIRSGIRGVAGGQKYAGADRLAGHALRGAAAGAENCLSAAVGPIHERDKKFFADHGDRRCRAVLRLASGGNRNAAHLPGVRRCDGVVHRHHCVIGRLGYVATAT
jgi:His/Glu/Gln/Arg/opine family amino acid ABC transporter permease subunit